MGFYGKLTGTTRLNFQFDKVYSNRASMDAAIHERDDGVAVGRLVLIEYSQSPQEDYLSTYFASNTVGSDKIYAYTDLEQQQVWNGEQVRRAKITDTGRIQLDNATRGTGLKMDVGTFVQAFKRAETDYLINRNGRQFYVAQLTDNEGGCQLINASEFPSTAEIPTERAVIEATISHPDVLRDLKSGEVIDKKTYDLLSKELKNSFTSSGTNEYTLTDTNFKNTLKTYAMYTYTLKPLNRQFNTQYDANLDIMFSSAEGMSYTNKENYIARLKKGTLKPEAQKYTFLIERQDFVEINKELVFLTWNSQTAADNYDLVVEEKSDTDNYYTNYTTDRNKYGAAFDGKGYDSTVWQKTYVGGIFKYVNIAELNSVVPSFGLKVDAPSVIPVAPHFDKANTSNVYYDLHWAPSWGVRVKAADGDLTGQLMVDGEFSDTAGKTLLTTQSGDLNSDTKTIWEAQAYSPDGQIKKYVYAKATENNQVVYKWQLEDDENPIPQEDKEIAAAIYWNKAGFNSDKQSSVSTTGSGIFMRPTGKSGQRYRDHDGAVMEAKEDTYEFSFQMPEIGNAVSDMWDVVYGTPPRKEQDDLARDRDVDWKQASEISRADYQTIYSKNNTNGFVNGDTLAGVIRSAQDIIGLVIEDLPSDFTFEDINKKNKKLNPDWIYHHDGKYYRKVRKFSGETLNGQVENSNDYNDFDITPSNYYKQVNLVSQSTVLAALKNGLKVKYFSNSGVVEKPFGDRFDSGLQYCSNGTETDSFTIDGNAYSLRDFYEAYEANKNTAGNLTYIYEPNKYYILNGNGCFELVAANDMPDDENVTYYAYFPLVVKSDESHRYNIGAIWDTRLTRVPKSITLETQTASKYVLQEIEDFAKTKNTLNATLKQMREIIDGKNGTERGGHSMLGLTNQVKDLVSKFGNLQPNTLTSINNYGQISSVTFSTDKWISANLDNSVAAAANMKVTDGEGQSVPIVTSADGSPIAYTSQSSEQIMIAHNEVSSVASTENVKNLDNENKVTLFADRAGHLQLVTASGVTNVSFERGEDGRPDIPYEASSITVTTVGGIKNSMTGNDWISIGDGTEDKPISVNHNQITSGTLSDNNSIDGALLSIDSAGHVKISSSEGTKNVQNVGQTKTLKVPKALTQTAAKQLIGEATKTSSGLMSITDKTKLDGINNVTTSTNGLMLATDKTKLDNLKGFKNFAVTAGSNTKTYTATSHEDTLKVAQGSNITLQMSDEGVLTINSAAQITGLSQTGSEVNPIFINAGGNPQATTYSLNKSVPSDAGFLIEENGKLIYRDLPAATKSAIGCIKPGDTLSVGTDGTLNVVTGTATTKGILSVGTNLSVSNGVVSVATGSKNNLGVLKAGTNINASDGTISVATGSKSGLGVLKVGDNVNVADGTISVATGSKDTLGLLQVGRDLEVSDGVISNNFSSVPVKALTKQSDGTITESDQPYICNIILKTSDFVCNV